MVPGERHQRTAAADHTQWQVPLEPRRQFDARGRASNWQVHCPKTFTLTNTVAERRRIVIKFAVLGHHTGSIPGQLELKIDDDSKWSTNWHWTKACVISVTQAITTSPTFERFAPGRPSAPLVHPCKGGVDIHMSVQSIYIPLRSIVIVQNSLS